VTGFKQRKFSCIRAISRVIELKTNVSGTKKVSETFVFSSTLTWLITRKEFSTFIRREIFKSYIQGDD
jgi:hypothetical protein